MSAHPERRAHPRVAATLTVRLGRKVGHEVVARTHDVGAGGARIECTRPLRVDEELRFELDTPGGHLHGVARVLRQHRHDVYALRFEQLAEPDRAALVAFVEAG